MKLFSAEALAALASGDNIVAGAVRIGVDRPAVTPTTRLDVDRIPSLAPRTAARSQPMCSVLWRSWWGSVVPPWAHVVPLNSPEWVRMSMSPQLMGCSQDLAFLQTHVLLGLPPTPKKSPGGVYTLGRMGLVVYSLVRRPWSGLIRRGRPQQTTAG